MNDYRSAGYMRAIAKASAILALLLRLGVGATPVGAAVPSGTPTFTHPLDITNSYHPFQAGAVKIFQGADGRAKTVAVHLYLSETRSFNWNGTTVECRVLRELAFENGELVESSDNYFAQADDGTVYYFGEVVDNYGDGVVVDHGGSWLVGGATLPSDPIDAGNDDDPTVFMPADPQVGDVFKPEDLPGIVDESAEVVRVGMQVKVPAGRYTGVIKIEETSALEAGRTNKWYAPGVGVVMEKAKREHLNLISSTLVSP